MIFFAQDAPSQKWAQVIGPGGRVELDFLPSFALANELAFHRTMAANARARILAPKGGILATAATAEDQRMARKFAQRLVTRKRLA